MEICMNNTLVRKKIPEIIKMLVFISMIISVIIFTSCVSSSPESVVQTTAEPVLKDSYPGEKDGKLFLWKLTRGPVTMHILGSVHLGEADFYPLDEKITQAFVNSDVLVAEVNYFEIDMTKIKRYMQTECLLQDNTALDDYLPPEEMEILYGILNHYGIPYETVKHFKPWLLETTIAMMSIMELNIDPSFGIDIHLSNEALQAGIDIVGLETGIEQIEFLNAIPLDVQVYSLLETLREFESVAAQIEELISCWQRGDVQGMEDLIAGELLATPQGEEYYQELLVNRNINWMDVLLSMCSEFEKMNGGNIFIVVGSGHLVGSDNLIDLLRGKGFEALRY
jgi:uncharacterized protein YbaP (TraB family)